MTDDTIKIEVVESSVHDFIGCDEHGNIVGVTAFDPKSLVTAVSGLPGMGTVSLDALPSCYNWTAGTVTATESDMLYRSMIETVTGFDPESAPPVLTSSTNAGMAVPTCTELDMLRDDNAKLENDLAYERYRVRQLELLLGAAKQPLSFAWHDQPDVAAPPPKGPPPIPARALRPLAGHPMPWLTE